MNLKRIKVFWFFFSKKNFFLFLKKKKQKNFIRFEYYLSGVPA